jgi:nicotinate-nucleotide adenylyltransferase
MRVGVLGGGFNPPTVAHMVLAEEARSQLALERVLLMPYSHPRHREVAEPGMEKRMRMAELAAEGRLGISASRLEIDRPGPTYTVDTLRLMNRRGDKPVLILGGDQAAALDSWYEYREVLKLAELAIAERDGQRQRLDAAMVQNAEFITMPTMAVSSSMVRSRRRMRGAWRCYVDDRVAEFIEEERLYL